MHKMKVPDFEDETSNQERANSTDMGDESKPVPLLPKTTGLSTDGKQCELYSETVACETSEFVEKEQA